MNAVTRTISAIALAASVANAWAADGKACFEGNCIPCHGADGKGYTPMGRKIHAKNLTESKMSEAEIVSRILEGTKDEKGQPRMPSFREKLSADEVSALAAYVQTFRKQP